MKKSIAAIVLAKNEEKNTAELWWTVDNIAK